MRHLDRIIYTVMSASLFLVFCFCPLLAGAEEGKDILFEKEAFIKSAEAKEVLDLGMVDCIAYALKKNTEIKIKKIDPVIAKYGIKKAESAFEPSLKGYFEYDETNYPGSASLLTGNIQDRSRRSDFNVGAEGKLVTNTQYDVNFNNAVSSSNSGSQRFFPDHESSVSASITQPVMKDFFGMGRDQADIVIARNNKEISDQSFEQEVINIVTRVIATYYDYLHHIDQYEIGEHALTRSNELFGIIQKRYAKGLASSVDLLEAEAGVAKREEVLLLFERVLLKAEDELKLQTNLIDDPAYWNADIRAKDKPVFEIREVDLVEGIKEAFVNRPDYRGAVTDLKNKDITVKTAANDLLPTIDVTGTYAANGLGDTYLNSFDQVKDGKHRSWSVGVNVKVPFGFAEEISDYKISKLEEEQTILAFSRLEQRIILEVRDAVRNVDIARRSVEAMRKTLNAEEKTYEAAKERFNAGQLSTHDMLQYQESYDLASLGFLGAVIAYNKALVFLEQAKGTTLAVNNIEIKEII
ncbi:MAG: TolC family protein [Candidatus Omnitrophica bacterium]|nr:TolC family protein [Candidatus Omnitrophota bacterium]